MKIKSLSVSMTTQSSLVKDYQKEETIKYWNNNIHKNVSDALDNESALPINPIDSLDISSDELTKLGIIQKSGINLTESGSPGAMVHIDLAI